MPGTGPVVYYDGTCGLCDRFVQFVLARDDRATFRFATFEGPAGAQALAAAGEPAIDGAEARAAGPGSVLVDAGDGRWLRKSRAVAFVLSRLGGPWVVLGCLLRLVPRVLADVGYDAVARVRHRIFGRATHCALPRPEWRARFLD